MEKFEVGDWIKPVGERAVKQSKDEGIEFPATIRFAFPLEMAMVQGNV